MPPPHLSPHLSFLSYLAAPISPPLTPTSASPTPTAHRPPCFVTRCRRLHSTAVAPLSPLPTPTSASPTPQPTHRPLCFSIRCRRRHSTAALRSVPPSRCIDIPPSRHPTAPPSSGCPAVPLSRRPVALSFRCPAVPPPCHPIVPPSRRPAVPPPSRRPAVPPSPSPSRRPAVLPSCRPAVPPSWASSPDDLPRECRSYRQLFERSVRAAWAGLCRPRRRFLAFCRTIRLDPQVYNGHREVVSSILGGGVEGRVIVVRYDCPRS